MSKKGKIILTLKQISDNKWIVEEKQVYKFDNPFEAIEQVNEICKRIEYQYPRPDEVWDYNE